MECELAHLNEEAGREVDEPFMKSGGTGEQAQIPLFQPYQEPEDQGDSKAYQFPDEPFGGREG